MEVRDQRADRAEPIRRRDVRGPSSPRRHPLARPSPALAPRSCPPPRPAACVRQCLARRGRHLVPLAVDPVLVDELALQRPERVEPDVQRDGGALDAGLLERAEQLIGEVEPGRRGGGRSRVDGRRPSGSARPVPIGRGCTAAAASRPHRAMTAARRRSNRTTRVPSVSRSPTSTRSPLRRVDERSRARAGARGGRGPPTAAGRRGSAPEDEHLGGTSTGPLPDQPSRQDARVVHDEQVRRAQPAADVAEARVLHRPVARSRTSRREESRGSAGVWAIASGGSS